MFITAFKDKDDTYRFVTQQYDIGTYLAIYKNDSQLPEDQTGLKIEEMKFHRKLRRNIVKEGNELLEESYEIPKITRKKKK